MMIKINELNENNKGEWVMYYAGYGKPEIGRIKDWNSKYVFVVYKCAGEWDNYEDYTAASTPPAHLFFTADRPDDYKT